MLEHPKNPALPLNMSKGENVSGADNQQEILNLLKEILNDYTPDPLISGKI